MFDVQLKRPYHLALTDYLICLLALTIMTYFYYGPRALIVIGIAAVTSVLTDFIAVKLRGKKYRKTDTSALVAGIILALLMPASVPYFVVAISCIFMIVVGKQAFGGNENPLFSAISVGFSFATLCFYDYIYLYPTPMATNQLPLDSVITEGLVSSFTHTYTVVGDTNFDLFSMLLGRMTGPMGGTQIIIITIAAVILMARGSISKLPFISTLAVLLAHAIFFPVRPDTSPLVSLTNELFGSSTLFALTFVACDFKFAPNRRLSRILYGVFTGLLTIVFKFYGGYEIGIFFALLITAPISSGYDILSDLIIRFSKFTLKFLKRLPFVIYRIIFAILSVLYIMFKFIGIIIYKKLISKLIIYIKSKNLEKVAITTETAEKAEEIAENESEKETEDIK